MRYHLLTLALAALATPAMAQTNVAGSGVEVSDRANSAVRPIGFANRAADDGVLVVIMRGSTLPSIGLEPAVEGSVKSAVAAARFDGKSGSVVSLRGIGRYARIHLVGVSGDQDSARHLRDAGGKLAQEMLDEAHPISILGDLTSTDALVIAQGFGLGQYRFDRYKTAAKPTSADHKVIIVTNDRQSAELEWAARGRPLVEGVTLSRDLSSEPANVIYPESFVSRIRDAFAGVGKVKIDVLDEAAMQRLKMGALLGVGQGSQRPSRLLVVEYNGGQGAPVALVGKGITFDSGGISLKPGTGMWEMKSDMSGAASAVGAVLSLAKSGAPVNVVAVAALAENMPGENAQRPGDVVRTMSGKTIEVLNTDAEGRLVLADANEYAVSRYKPAAVVTIATLTGAIVQALNDEYAGLFARDEGLAAALTSAASRTGEDVWRMPLHKNYIEDLKSDIADLKNVVEGGGPGAGLGATFVGAFVAPETPWAHLDIAGVNWADRSNAVTPKGASGWGVRLLDEMVRNWPK